MKRKAASGEVAQNLINPKFSLPSGRCKTVSVLESCTIAELKIAAQRALRQPFLRLAAPDGRLLDLASSLQLGGLSDRDSFTAVVQQPKIAATSGASFGIVGFFDFLAFLDLYVAELVGALAGGVVVWWCGGVVVWWCGGVVVWWCGGGVVVWWCSGAAVGWFRFCGWWWWWLAGFGYFLAGLAGFLGVGGWSRFFLSLLGAWSRLPLSPLQVVRLLGLFRLPSLR
eukprot:s2427_g18.t1